MQQRTRAARGAVSRRPQGQDGGHGRAGAAARRTWTPRADPRGGPADAPVEIVEFSDFQCPFCQRAYPTVMQVLKTYGDQVRLRLPPLPAAEPSGTRGRRPKPRRAPPSRASSGSTTISCSRTPSKLSDADLKQHGAGLGLDAPKFNACVDTRKFQDDVEADREAGNEGRRHRHAGLLHQRPRLSAAHSRSRRSSASSTRSSPSAETWSHFRLRAAPLDQRQGLLRARCVRARDQSSWKSKPP